MADETETYFTLERLIRNGSKKGTILKYMDKNGITPATTRQMMQEGSNIEFIMSPVACAAVSGRLNLMKHFISKGFDTTCKRYNLLHLAVQGHHHSVLKSLVEDHAADVHDIHDTDAPCGNTLLHFSAQLGQTDITGYLISSGLSVNAKDALGVTPLINAVHSGSIYTAKCLLSLGAEVKESGEDVLLHIAIARGDVNMVKFLCKNGVDPDPADCPLTPLQYAVRYQQYQTARFLVVECNVRMRPSLTEQSPFKDALQRGLTKIVKLFIEAGYNLKDDDLDFICQGVLPEDEDLASYIRRKVNNARNLEQLCCFRMRSIMGRNVMKKIELLPLPRTPKDSLALVHISHS